MKHFIFLYAGGFNFDENEYGECIGAVEVTDEALVKLGEELSPRGFDLERTHSLENMTFWRPSPKKNERGAA